MLTRLWYCVQDCIFLSKYAVNIHWSISRSDSACLASVRCVEQSHYRKITSFGFCCRRSEAIIEGRVAVEMPHPRDILILSSFSDYLTVHLDP